MVHEESEEQDNSQIFGQRDSHVLPQQGEGGGARSVPLNRLTLDILIFCQDHGIFWYQLISLEWPIWMWTLFIGVRSQRSGSWILRWSPGYTGGSLRITRVRSPSSIFLHIQEGQESRGINALVQRWKFKKKYAFSPLQLILYKYAWQSRSEWCDKYDVSKTRPSVGSFTEYLV